MYRIDIMTSIGCFTAHEEEIRGPVESGKSFAEIATDIARGTFFLGYPPNYPRDEAPVSCMIKDDCIVQAYVVYPYRKPVEPSVEEPKGPAVGLSTITAKLEYLGNNLKVELLQYLDDNGLYTFLPVTVNDLPQAMQIRTEALTQLLVLYAEDKLGLKVTDFRVLVPEVPMSMGASIDYLSDYILQTNKERVGSNAKAWNGWKQSEEE